MGNCTFSRQSFKPGLALKSEQFENLYWCKFRTQLKLRREGNQILRWIIHM